MLTRLFIFLFLFPLILLAQTPIGIPIGTNVYIGETLPASVTASSSWTPLNLPNIVLEWIPDTAITNSAGFATNLPDATGNGNAGTNTLSGDIPKWLGNTLNGHAVLYFNGSVVFLKAPATLSLAQPFEILCVIGNIPPSPNSSSRSLFSGTGNNANALWNHDSDYWGLDNGTGNLPTYSKINTNANKFTVELFAFAGNYGFNASNNVLYTSGSTVGTSGLSGIVWNQNKYPNGVQLTNQMADLTICSSTNTALNRSNYFAWATNTFGAGNF